MALKRFVFLTLILPLALFLLGCLPVSAQESKSEKKQAVHPDAAAVQRLLQLADDSSITNLKQALIYAKEALHTAGEKKYLKGQADAYLRVADLTIAIGNSDSISTLCQRAMELYQHLKDPEGVAACQATRGYYAYLHGNLAEARKYYLPSRQYYQSVKDPKGLARLQNEFGLLHWTEGNYPAALTCFQQAILIYERINDRKSYSYAENNLGLIYLDLRQDSLALRHFHRSLAMDQARGDEIGISLAYGNIGEAYQHLKKDSLALYYFQQSLTLSRRQESQEGIAFCLKSIGLLKVSQQRYSEGLAHLLEAYHVYHTIDYKEGMAHCLSGIADAYERTGQLSLALMQAKECLHLARELNSKLLISQASGILAKVYKRQRDYPKALEYFELFHLYQDSLLDAENIRQLEGLRFSFQLDKKEVENGKLRQEQALQEARSQKQLMLMLLTGGGLLVTLLIMVLLWKSNQSRKRTNLLLTRQKDSIGQQNASLAALNTKISQQRDHLWKLHRESEQHKAQILCQNEALSVTNEKLSELDREKDGLMSVVAHDLRAPLNRTIGLTQLIRLTGSLNDEQENLLQLIEKSAREGGYLINDLLTLSYEQQAGHKVTLSQICLPDWIETLLIGFRPQAEAKSIELHYQKPAAACLIDTNEEALTRILDNLLSNALKFTQPGKNVFVTLSTSPDGIRISVLDEGPGISPEEQQKLFKKFQKLTPRPTGNESSTGLGLAIVKTLSEKIGGEISVQSELGKGTQFTLFIPQSLCEQTDTHTLNLSAN